MSRIARWSFLLFALWATTAWASTPTLAFRGGMAMEGAQGNLQDGWTAGASVEWPQGWGVLGIDGDWAEDGRAAESGTDYNFRVVHLGPAIRRSFGTGAVRPALEAGAGLAYVHGEVRDHTGLLDETTRVAAAGWLGGGVALRLDPHWDARLEGRYQFYVIDMPDVVSGGGNLGDHYGVTLGFAFHH